MADILLIHPMTGAMDAIRDSPHLPLGVLHAAALAARHYEVAIVDLRVEVDWRARIGEELAKNPLLAGFSVMSGLPIQSALEVSAYIKENSETPVVWGGPHPTLAPVQTVEHPLVDIIVTGDGEQALLELADRLSQGRPLSGIDGVWFAGKDGRAVANDPARELDLNTLPEPPYHLLDMSRYVQKYLDQTVLNLETSRGCNRRCLYCYHTGFGKRHQYRQLTAQNALERIAGITRRFGVDGVYLVDDNFFTDKERGMEIARALAAAPRGPSWQIQGVDIPSMLWFDKKKLSILEKGRLLRITAGAESGSDKTLKYLRKPQTAEMIRQANQNWSTFDIRIYYSFMAGFAGETIADLKKTTDLMLEILRENKNARTSPIYSIQPFPGTPLFDEAIEKYGLTPPRTLEEWAARDYARAGLKQLNPRVSNVVERLYTASLCMDRKFDDYKVPWWLSTGVRLYGPLARWRVGHLFHQFPVENRAAKILEHLMMPKEPKKRPWTI